MTLIVKCTRWSVTNIPVTPIAERKEINRKPALGKIPGSLIPQIYSVPIAVVFRRSFFNNCWGGLAGVETGKIENKPAAARTRNIPSNSMARGKILRS
jgi:hypothetical protein